MEPPDKGLFPWQHPWGEGDTEGGKLSAFRLSRERERRGGTETFPKGDYERPKYVTE